MEILNTIVPVNRMISIPMKMMLQNFMNVLMVFHMILNVHQTPYSMQKEKLVLSVRKKKTYNLPRNQNHNHNHKNNIEKLVM
ncbi:hypothetical protein BLA29_012335 [Euroglyphus maynei]|uniref:Uncharacterized protein n=1 Tax=Euroglyphus maynei TaxID=6958 RepID=A0A1Y3B555_EURMA|nr:hypothetical protein BLA29_012335 [Euroglyphus maynei]